MDMRKIESGKSKVESKYRKRENRSKRLNMNYAN